MKVGMPHPATMKMPTMPHIAKASAPKTKIHPAGQMRVRLPMGEVDTKAGDPGVSAPGIGRF
jgi:hypothetical protein